jgi:hypothetical protein
MPAILSDCSAYDICPRVRHDEKGRKRRKVKRTDVVHLVCYILEPRMRRLDTRDHLSQLCADNSLSIQRFAECLPLL